MGYVSVFVLIEAPRCFLLKRSASIYVLYRGTLDDPR